MTSEYSIARHGLIQLILKDTAWGKSSSNSVHYSYRQTQSYKPSSSFSKLKLIDIQANQAQTA